MKAVANGQTEAQKCTTNVPELAWEALYDVATNIGHNLTRKFWETLDNECKSEADVVVCLKGKNQREIMQVYRHTLWAKHLGEMLKQGWRIVYVGKRVGEEITWGNWKYYYQIFTIQSEKKAHEYDPEMTYAQMAALCKKRQTERNFSEAASVTGRRSLPTMQECFYQRVRRHEVEIEDKVALRREAYTSKVVSNAKKILKVL